jgi:hypothetical protein
MPIDFDAVFQSEKACDSLYDLWYEALQEEANHVLTLTWSGGGMCSGENRVVEWNEMYFSWAMTAMLRRARSSPWRMRCLWWNAIGWGGRWSL